MNKTVIATWEAGWVPVPESGCWLWTKGTNDRGYGQIRSGDRIFYTHRISYELKNGPIPKGMFVCHRCDVTSCCNPDHLFIGTQKENMVDAVRKRRQVWGARNGHAKLTASEVIAIRNSTARGMDLAAQYRISEARVSEIRRLKTWKHL